MTNLESADVNRPKRILVVHEDKLIRGLLRLLMEDEGYEVLTASTGAEGVAIIRKSRPPIDLADWGIPQMAGAELARECCSLGVDLRVLYVSDAYPGEGPEPVSEFPVHADALLRKAKELLLMEPEHLFVRPSNRISRAVN